MKTIPKTIKQASGRLTTLGGIVTASEWEKAAIVWAFTRDGSPGDWAESRSSARLTPNEFAREGIAGLRSANTVRAYREAWQTAMKDGAPDIQPGDEFVIPATEWPPTNTGVGANSMVTLRKKLVADPAKVVRQIIKDAESKDDKAVSASVVEALAEGVAQVEETKTATVAAIIKIPTPTHTRTTHPPQPITNWNAELWGHLNGVLDALKALREDKFTLDSFNSQMLMLLAHVLPEALNDEADESTLFSEIDEFLKEKGAR